MEVSEELSRLQGVKDRRLKHRPTEFTLCRYVVQLAPSNMLSGRLLHARFPGCNLDPKTYCSNKCSVKLEFLPF